MTNTRNFLADREDAVQFAIDLLSFSEINSLSITITKLEKSEEFSVHFVTDTLSDGIVKDLAQSYYETPMNTLRENTQAG